MKNQLSWKPVLLDYPLGDAPNLSVIINGDFPALIFRNFYPAYQCKKVCDKITISNDLRGCSCRPKHIGTTLSSHLHSKREYFENVDLTERHINKVFTHADPRQKIYMLLSEITKTDDVIVADEKGKQYSSCVIRIHGNGNFSPLHRDSANFEANQFLVSTLKKQLSCVLYLQKPQQGGQLIIYRKKWNREDEKYRQIEFGYIEEAVSGARYCKIDPIPGDLVVFNPLFFHKILPVCGEKARISLAMFFAFRDAKNLVVWS